MAEEPLLGISATIQGDDIKKGADMFVQHLDRMEKAADHAAKNIDSSIRDIELKLIQISEQIKIAEYKMQSLSNISGKSPQSVSTEKAALQKEISELQKKRDSMMRELITQSNSRSSSSRDKGLVKEIKEAKAAYQREVEDLQRQIDSVSRKKSELTSRINMGGQATDSSSEEEIINVQKQLKKLTDEELRLQEAIERVKGHISEADTDLEEYANSCMTASKKLSEIKREMEGLDPSSDRFKELAEEAKMYQEQIDKVANSLKKSKRLSISSQLEKLRAEIASLDKSDPEYKKKIEEARELNRQMVAINDETSIQSTLLTRLMGGTRNFGQMLDMLPEPIKNAINQFNQLIKVGLRFIATPIGMVVTTLALAFKSLQMYMANTSDGQMVMAKATGYAEGVFNRLTKSIYDFIRGIRGIGQAADEAEAAANKDTSASTSSGSNASNSKTFIQRIQEGWRKNKEITRLNNLIEEQRQIYDYYKDFPVDAVSEWTGKSIFADAYGNVIGKEEYLNNIVKRTNELIEERKRAYNDKNDLWYMGWLNSVQDYVDSLKDAGKEMANIKAQALEIERAMKAWSVVEAQINADISAEESKLDSPYATTANKLGITKRIAELTERKSRTNLEFAQRKYENATLGKIIDSNDIIALASGKESDWNNFEAKYGMTSAQVNAVIEAYGALVDAQTSYSQLQDDNADNISQLHTQMLNEAREYAERMLSIEQDFSRQEAEILQKREDVALQALSDSVDKRMAMRANEYRKAIEQLKIELQNAINEAKDSARTEYKNEPSLNGRPVNPLVYADIITPQQEEGLTTSEKAIRERYLLRVNNAKTSYELGQQTASYNYNEVNDLLAQYQDYTEKKLQLDIQYGEDRARIMKAIAMQEAIINSDASSDIEKANAQQQIIRLNNLSSERERQYKKSVENVDKENNDRLYEQQTKDLKNNPAYMLAMQNVRKVSTDALNNLLTQLRTVEAEVSKLDPQQAQTIANLIESINKELIERSPFEKLKIQLTEIRELENQRKSLKDISEKGGGKLNGENLTKEEADNRLIEIEGKLYVAHENYQTALVKATNQLQGIYNQIAQIGSSIGGKWGNAVSGVASIGASLISFKQNYSVSAMKANGMMNENGKMTGLGKASVYLAAAQAAYQSAELVASIFPRRGAQSKYESYARKQSEINKLTQSVMSYELAAIRAAKADEQWFGSDNLERLRDSWEIASKAKDQYFEKLNEQQERYHNKDKDDNWSGVVASAITGAVTGAIIGGTSGSAAGPGYGTIIGAAIGSAAGTIAGIATNNLVSDYDATKISALDNLRIETRKRKKSFLGIGGHDQETADLRTWAKEKYGSDLFDAEGWVDVELARQILVDYGEKLQGQTQETLEQLIELKEQYDEYKEALHQYVSSLYEPLVDSMVDAIWDWFDTGVDALASFKDKCSQTFRSIVSDMMRTIVLKNVFGTYQDDIEKLYDKYAKKEITQGSLIKEVANLTSDLMGRAEDAIPVLQDVVTTISDELKNSGVDLFANSSSSGSVGASASMTQETGTEIKGRLTAIQLQGESIIGQLMLQTATMSALSVSIGVTMGYVSEIRDIQLQSQEYLRKIQINTNELFAINKRLENIDNNTKNL